MKRFICIVGLICLSFTAFADRPIQSARMGKVGTLHPNSWRISESPDVKGEGENYTFEVSIFKGAMQIDFFSFELNEGAKNTKRSQFNIAGDVASEKFGNEVSLEFIDIVDGKLKIELSIKSKVLYAIIYKDNKYKANMIEAELDNKELLLEIDKEAIIHLNKDTLVQIKSTEK